MDFMQEIKISAQLLYQNREQEAYEKINNLLGNLNQMLQLLVTEASEEIKPAVLAVMNEFVDAYQHKDNLALADLFFYVIPELVQMTEERTGV